MPFNENYHFFLFVFLLPLVWENAELIPIHKEGDREVPSNNQPVTLVVVASKVCERLAIEQFS